MIFVIMNPYPSSLLRGQYIADAIGCKTLVGSIGEERNGSIVFIKDAERQMVIEAKERGNRIILDPLDLYCYNDRRCSFADLVDTVIVPNSKASWFYGRNGFTNANFTVIPHQWDTRITGEAPQDRLRAAYIGHKFNRPAFWTGERFTDMTDDVLPVFSKYNLHLSLNARSPTHVMLKPAVKIASAAAVGANVVAYPDPSALEILGRDYPFYVDREPMTAIRIARESFGTPEWERGREMMNEVRKKTSLAAVAEMYRRLDDRAAIQEAA